MTRRTAIELGMLPWLPRKAKAQAPELSKLPFNQEIVRGDVTLFLMKDEAAERLIVAARCADSAVSRAVVTAFYLQVIPELSKTPLLRSETRVVPCINAGALCMADPFTFTVDTLAYLKVETLRSVAQYEFR